MEEKLECTYLYKGQRVFLAYTTDMPGVQPLDEYADMGCYPVELYNGCNVCLTVDDVYGEYCDEYEIEITQCVNPEFDKALRYGWYTKCYAEVDNFERQLCVKTTKYYDWTSELSHTTRYLNKHAEEHCISRDFADSQRKIWNEVVEEYKSAISKDNPLDLPDVPTFEEVMEYADVRVEPITDIDELFTRKQVEEALELHLEQLKKLGATLEDSVCEILRKLIENL